ncbi:hypothetical protein QJS64_21325 (plasmid) [Paraclostridium bifermentans]|uniref:Uncharacterized protein n=1 Tax=Paraclostridium bifermentans TaxID=1490 RepID=A0ABY8R8G9_PARBF|nr:hypothetical protein QJS64_21325 [Paraclostridium bifermentans]
MKIIGITSSLSLVLIGGVLIFNDEGSSQVKETFSSIASHFGLDTDLSEYKTAIDKPITNNGYTITLNKVTLDKTN